MCGRAGVRNKFSIVKELELGAPYPFRGRKVMRDQDEGHYIIP